MLDENASKFAIFLEYKNQGIISSFCATLFFPNEYPGLYDLDLK